MVIWSVLSVLKGGGGLGGRQCNTSYTHAKLSEYNSLQVVIDAFEGKCFFWGGCIVRLGRECVLLMVVMVAGLLSTTTTTTSTEHIVDGVLQQNGNICIPVRLNILRAVILYITSVCVCVCVCVCVLVLVYVCS